MPWYVRGVRFDADKRMLTIGIDFKKGSRFPYEGTQGLHPVHDTQTKRYRHLNFFQHECFPSDAEAHASRWPGSPDRAQLGRNFSGFTLLFEALILAMCRRMPFAAVARLVESWPQGGGHL